MKGFSAFFQRFHPLRQLESARQKWQAQTHLPAELNALLRNLTRKRTLI